MSEEVLTGRQRIGNNIVDGHITGKLTRTISRAGRSASVLTPRGEISLETFEDRYAALNDAEGQGCQAVIVDMTDVPFVDCAGFGMLMSCCRLLRSEGRGFALVGASPFLLRALTLTHLHRVLRAYGSLDAALEALDMESLDLEAGSQKNRSADSEHSPKKEHSSGHHPFGPSRREQGTAASGPAHEAADGVSLPA